MRFACSPSPWSEAVQVDLLACFVSQPSDGVPAELLPIDQALDGLISSLFESGDFRGEAGEQLVTWTGGRAGAPRLVLMGVGENPDPEAWRLAAGQVARLIERYRVRGAAVLASPKATRNVVEGLALGVYRFDRYLKDEEQFDSSETSVQLLGGDDVEAVRRGELVAEGIAAARDLVNGPGELVTPSFLANWAQEVAEHESLDVKILDANACRERGMGAFLSVAQGTNEAPRFIHLTYRPAGKPRRKIALVGKGVTFDSGGLDIKSASNMLLMKKDMSGAATVLGVAKVLGRLAPDSEVHVITAATENLLGPEAYKPGDIVRASNGLTIEVLNTDAEGRMTLADALVYTSQLGVDAIVDLATLTGACKMALGDRIAGLFSDPDELGDEVRDAAVRAGEKVWRLPLDEVYWDRMKSPIADMGNIARSPGTPGATTAALFLKRFVHGPAWAHLDMSAPVWTERDEGHLRKGATGFGVATLIELITA